MPNATLDGQPNVLCGQPNVLKGQSNALDGQPNVLDGQPDTLDGQSNAFDGKICQIVVQFNRSIRRQPAIGRLVARSVGL